MNRTCCSVFCCSKQLVHISWCSGVIRVCGVLVVSHFKRDVFVIYVTRNTHFTRLFLYGMLVGKSDKPFFRTGRERSDGKMAAPLEQPPFLVLAMCPMFSTCLS